MGNDNSATTLQDEMSVMGLRKTKPTTTTRRTTANKVTDIPSFSTLSLKPSKPSKPNPSKHCKQKPVIQHLKQSSTEEIICDESLNDPEYLAISLVPKQNECSSIWNIFSYRKQLGKGVSCRVLLVEHKQNKKIFALKEMTRSNSKNYLLFHSEVCILRKIKHPNIVRLDDVYMDSKNFYLCLEYCSGGTMLERIISDNYFTEQVASNYIKTMLETIQFMHNNNIAHLDLKLNNIVFNNTPKPSKNDKNNNKTMVSKLKIIDFGLSEQIKDENDVYLEIHGSLHYFPPEIFNDNGRSGYQLKKGDIWSVGVMAYLILSGKLPFFGNSQKDIINCIKNGSFEWPKNVKLSNDCKSFISSLLNPDSNKRLSAEEALKHKWIISKPNHNKCDNDDNKVCNKLMIKLQNFNFQNKLQQLLIGSILSEMTEKDKEILIEGIEELDTNKDGYIDQEDIMAYILKNHLNGYSTNCNEQLVRRQSVRRQSEDVLMEIKVAMSIFQDSLFANDIISEQIQIEEGKECECDDIDSIQHDLLLEDLMDEVEVDFKDYNFKEDEEEEIITTSMITTSTGSSNVSVQSIKEDGISIELFRNIMNKPAKQQSINVDGIIQVLDPNNSGIIKIDKITSFQRRLSSFRFDENNEIHSNLNNVGKHQDETIVLNTGNMHNTTNRNGTNSDSNSIANLNEDTIIIKGGNKQSPPGNDSDSEIDFPDDLYDNE